MMTLIFPLYNGTISAVSSRLLYLERADLRGAAGGEVRLAVVSSRQRERFAHVEDYTSDLRTHPQHNRHG